jgi:predicted nucleic acid-binding protein
MATKPRVYVDACPFIDAVKFDLAASGDPLVIVNASRNDDVYLLKLLLKAGRDGIIEVFTSTLTISECRHLGDGYVPDEAKRLFRAILLSSDPVQLVQPSVFICEDARDLTWKYDIASLRGADAIHIASAKDRGCAELLTTDGRLIAHAADIAKIGVRVIYPRDTLLLPDEYKQEDLFPTSGN